MPQNYKPTLSLLIFVFLFLLSSSVANAQYIFTEKQLPERISLHSYAWFLKDNSLTVNDVISGKAAARFQPVKDENRDLGFTDDNFWITFELDNHTPNPLEYYLETARPITDLVELYIVNPDGSYTKKITGDTMDFSKRAYKHRKSIFRLDLPPNLTQRYVIHFKSDGEVINLPLVLRSSENLMSLTSLEQFTFGIFYGILIIAAIIYLFFFFGLKERTFIYYAMYVTFIGLLQFALDGYFYQYFTPGGGWISRHSVLLFAIIAAFFLGRYSQLFLELNRRDRTMNRLFDVLYGLLAILFLVLVFVPAALPICYPMANILGMCVLILIITSVARLQIARKPVDGFFRVGILFLIAGFVVFILNNFGQIPVTFFSQNSSKFGTGVEVIFLSLSMANLIRKVKNEREEFNRLALEKSEEMNDMKSYFLSNISHELRTPLNAIMSLSAELASSSPDEKTRHDSQVIKYSAHSLLSSVNDILDFSKIEKGEIVLEPTRFEPIKMLEHIKNNAATRAKDQNLEFHYSKSDGIPDVLSGDAVRLAQILNNVLSNAIKFTAEGSVSLAIGGKEMSKNVYRLTLTVGDTGVGITKEKMNNIFGSFTQDNINNKRKFGGLGLGLYIVKTLVDMQGGTIKMDSTPGEGTICTIAIDYDIVKMEKPMETTNDPAIFDLGGKHILVVEDNAINQLVIKAIIKKWLNTTAVYANNGQEALDAMREHNFDLVLMDLQMPVMDGYEATIAIRKGEVGDDKKNIPIIAVTADVMETTKATVKEIGMNEYLSKPLKIETLYEAVKRLA